MKSKFNLATPLTVALLSLALAACGGGSDSAPGGGTTGGGGSGVTLTGVVSVGRPVTSATVTVREVTSAGDASATPMATVSAGADGTYSAQLAASFTGAVMVEATDVAFTDLATGNAVTGQTLRAGLEVGTATAPVASVTPLTEVAVRRATDANSKTLPAALTSASTLVSQLILGGAINIVATAPANVTTNVGTTGEKEYGLALAALSQVATSTGGLANTISQVAADVKDNDKIDLTGPAINNGLATVIANTTINQTGITTLASTTLDETIVASTFPPGTTTNYRYAQLFDNFFAAGGNQISAADGSVAFQSTDNTATLIASEPGWERTGGTLATLSTTDDSGSSTATWSDAGNNRTLTFPDSSLATLVRSTDGRYFSLSNASAQGANLMFGIKTATSGYTNSVLSGTYRRPRYAVEFIDFDENGSYIDKYSVIRIDEFTFDGAGGCTLTVNWSPRRRSFATTGASGFTLGATESVTPANFPNCAYSVSDGGMVTIDANLGDPNLIGFGWVSEDGNTFIQTTVTDESIGGDPAIREGKFANLSVATKVAADYTGVTPSGKTYAFDLLGREGNATSEVVFAGPITATFNVDGTTTETGIGCKTTTRTYTGTYGAVSVADSNADCVSAPSDWGFDLDASGTVDPGERGLVSNNGIINFGTPGALETWYLNYDASVMFTVQGTAPSTSPVFVDSVLAIGIQTN